MLILTSKKNRNINQNFLYVLQSIHGCKKFYWATRWVPNELVIGGDQPFVGRLNGVSTSPLVGSMYNMGVWDMGAAAWVDIGTVWTLAGAAVGLIFARLILMPAVL